MFWMKKQLEKSIEKKRVIIKSLRGECEYLSERDMVYNRHSLILDNLGMIALQIPQIDGSDDFEVDPEELRRSDEIIIVCGLWSWENKYLLKNE